MKGAAAGASVDGAKTIHERVAVKEEGLQHHLQYDWYTRGSLLDHFLGSGVDLASFMRSEYYETGDFVLGAYRMTSRRAGGSAIVTLERSGTVAGLAVSLRKELLLRSGEARVPGAVCHNEPEQRRTEHDLRQRVQFLAPGRQCP